MGTPFLNCDAHTKDRRVPGASPQPDTTQHTEEVGEGNSGQHAWAAYTWR